MIFAGSRDQDRPLDHAEKLRLAEEHATRGWPVFPVTPDKAPYPKFMDWERSATTNLDMIRLWWTDPRSRFKEALPAICPGRVKRVVIDVDQHPDGPQGFLSLIAAGVHIPDTVPRYKSLSGLGQHYFYQGDITSRNGLYPGVDRKARGGYVVAVYDLLRVPEITVRLPVPFHGSTSFNPSTEHPYGGDAEDWLTDLSGSTVSPAVRSAVKDVKAPDFTGHDNLVMLQAYLVHLGTEGHGGVPESLEQLRAAWINSPHVSKEDPQREWVVALLKAIKKFGGFQK